jgi:hypothetical protein
MSGLKRTYHLCSLKLLSGTVPSLILILDEMGRLENSQTAKL